MKLLYKILMLCTTLFVAANSNAQDSKKQEKTKSHIVIVNNENGKETRIDTTFSSEVAMKEFLKDHDMDAPNPPEPPIPPDAVAPPKPPMPPSSQRKESHRGKEVVYNYRYNYDDDENENDALIISFDKKEFSKIIDQLNNTISELEKDKNVTQKSIQKEINDLKKSVNDLSEKTKLMHKTVKKVIIKDTEKE